MPCLLSYVWERPISLERPILQNFSPPPWPSTSHCKKKTRTFVSHSLGHLDSLGNDFKCRETGASASEFQTQSLPVNPPTKAELWTKSPFLEMRFLLILVFRTLRAAVERDSSYTHNCHLTSTKVRHCRIKRQTGLTSKFAMCHTIVNIE